MTEILTDKCHKSLSRVDAHYCRNGWPEKFTEYQYEPLGVISFVLEVTDMMVSVQFSVVSFKVIVF